MKEEASNDEIERFFTLIGGRSGMKMHCVSSRSVCGVAANAVFLPRAMPVSIRLRWKKQSAWGFTWRISARQQTGQRQPLFIACVKLARPGCTQIHTHTTLYW